MDGKVIGISSIIPQNGAKYTAINLSHFLKKINKTKKIIILDFDFEFPMSNYEELRNVELNIDKLASSSLEINPDTIEEYIVKTKMGVDMIKGSYLHSPSFFSEKFLSLIVNISKELYDYVIIVFNTYNINAGTIVSLLNSEKLILIAKNNASNELMIQKSLKNLKTYYPENKNIDIIYNFKNHYSKSNFINDIDSTQLNILGVLEYAQNTVDNNNLQKKSKFGKKSVNDSFFKKLAKNIRREMI